MRSPPDTAERRPGGGGVPDDGADNGNVSVMVTRGACKWLLAAARTGDHRAVEIVLALHPASQCPARAERAA